MSLLKLKSLKNFHNKSIVSLSFLIFMGAVSSSCSLKYGSTPVVEDKTPEFVFSGVEMTRYEDKKKKVELKADAIEQYKGSSSSYVKDVDFSSYDSDNKIATEGSCGYLLLDTDNEVYELYDDIKLFSKTKEATVFAKSLRWNGKSEQLVSGRGENVRIEKDDIIIYGSGFSASGASGEFSFTGMVSGNIETKEAGSTDSDSAEVVEDEINED